jgi:hypothetical protein
MTWLEIAAFIVIGFIVLKFIVKPLFKVLGFLALVLIAWWFLHGF